MLGLLAVLALILANGYFVAVEFAFVAVRRPPINEQAEAGDRRALAARHVLDRLSFMLSGAQLGITVTSLLLGFIADRTLGAALRPALDAAGLPPGASLPLSLAIGFLLATTAQMVLGELGPKNLAIARPESLSLRLARSVRVFLKVAGPLIRLFDGSANALLRAVGITPAQELSEGVSAEELGHIIEASTAEGALEPDQARLLSRTLDFRGLRAAEAMVPRPAVDAIAVDATCDELRRLTLDSGHSRFPVTGGDLDDVVGVVEAKDVFSVPVEHRDTTPVRALMQPALAMPETTLLGPLLTDLRAAHTQLAVLVDEHGGTAGIVTLEDIVEELVGHITDEFDPDEPAVRPLPGGAWLVPGPWRLDECERDTGVALPEGDYETVGGLVMDRLGRIPEVGDVVEVDGASLRVLDLHGLAVGHVRLTPPPTPPAWPPDEDGSPT